MRILNNIMFTLIILVLNIQCEDRVINTCGQLEYKQPTNADECKEEGEICCFVKIEDPDNNKELKFCVSSPSDIEMDDVKNEIKDYTGYNLKELKCNKSQFIFNNYMKTLLMIVFILF